MNKNSDVRIAVSNTMFWDVNRAMELVVNSALYRSLSVAVDGDVYIAADCAVDGSVYRAVYGVQR